MGSKTRLHHNSLLCFMELLNDEWLVYTFRQNWTFQFQLFKLGIGALLRAGCDCELGSFFCIATKFFGGEADTVHKAIGGGGDGDART